MTATIPPSAGRRLIQAMSGIAGMSIDAAAHPASGRPHLAPPASSGGEAGLRAAPARRLPRRALAVLLAVAGPASAQTALGPVTVSGDLRARFEEDWDSHTATDSLRDDRGRLRLRARLGATADLGDGFRVEARARTGVAGSQQGANVTFADFDGNPVETTRILAERYALRWRRGGVTVEGGRMAFPFFTSNEYFWDADIPPLGGAATVAVQAKSVRLRLTGGGFRLPSGLTPYSGALYAGQAVAQAGGATAALGVFRIQADRTDPDRLIQLDGNGSRDYTVLALNGQWRRGVGGRPLAITADLYRNLASYATATDAVGRAYADARTGFVLGAGWGDVAAPGRWRIGARYVRLEKLSLDASYANDDPSRFGTAQQAANTDIAGPDLYADWMFVRHWTLGARASFMNRISTPENDRRGRVDLTFSF